MKVIRARLLYRLRLPVSDVPSSYTIGDYGSDFNDRENDIIVFSGVYLFRFIGCEFGEILIRVSRILSFSKQDPVSLSPWIMGCECRV